MRHHAEAERQQWVGGRVRLAGLLVSAIATLALSLPATAGAADLSAGSAVSSGGLVVNGHNATTPGGGDFTVNFDAVIPNGECTATSLAPGVDFCKPWALIEALHLKGGFGTDALTQDWDCATLTNPTSWSDGYEVENPAWGLDHPVRPRSGIHFDVPCDEGSGYDFFRMRIDDNVLSDGRPMGMWYTGFWGIEPGTGFHATWGDYKISTTAQNDGYEEAVRMRLFGHDADGFHLVASGSGRMSPAASLIRTIASRTGDG